MRWVGLLLALGGVACSADPIEARVNRRRPELQDLFRHYVYGVEPVIHLGLFFVDRH